MSLHGIDTKLNIPDHLVRIIAKESDRLLIKPEALLIVWIDEVIRNRGLDK